MTEAPIVTYSKIGKPARVQDYYVRKVLGHGAFGEVFLAAKRGSVYAIKHMTKAHLNKNETDPRLHAMPVFDHPSVKKEIAMLKKLAHPNIVQMFELIVDNNRGEIFLVLEYVDGGTSQPRTP